MIILIQFLICGLLTSLLFPPFLILPLGFIAFPFLYNLLIKEEFLNSSKFFQFSSGILYGISMNFIILIWIKEPFLLDSRTANLSILSYVLVLYCSIFYGVSFLIINCFKNKAIKIILIPLLFVLIEIIRENFSFGFPWITFALVNSSNLFSLNLIYYLGTNSLSYFTILIFLIPAVILLTNYNNYLNFVKNYLYFSFTVIFVFTILIFIRIYEDKNLINKNYKITMIQSNLSQIEKSNNLNLNIRIDYINNMILNNNSDLIIFAENEFPYIVHDNKSFESISSLLKDKQSIIMGATSKNNSKFYNSMFLIERNNIKRFDKIILVPFGEFLPFRKYLNFFNPIVGEHDFSIGKSNRIVSTLYGLNFIPIICYEIVFFNNLLDSFNEESKLMINITNDSWFGNFSGPYQHFYLSRLRAVEFNKSLIRVSNNGISALIDNKGTIINYSNLNKKEVINTEINLPYDSKNLKDYHLYILLFLFICSFIFIFRNNESH